MNDSHIHIGQFYENYTSATKLFAFVDDVGIDKFAVFSTSIWEENYYKVIGEIVEICELSSNRAVPILWVTPNMLVKNKIHLFEESGVIWKGVKIHTVDGWDNKLIENVVQYCLQKKFPLIIHTGEFDTCNAFRFREFIEYYPQVHFILAHGRPIFETESLLQCYGNTFVDTSFMPISVILKLCTLGFSDRILWGSDYPIHWSQINILSKARYLQRVQRLKRALNTDDFMDVMELNFLRIFS